MMATGFSLLEILLVLAILAIGYSVSFLPLQALSEHIEENNAKEILEHLLQVGKTTAAIDQIPIGFCASGHQTSCDSHQDWSAGQLLFIDHDHNGVISDSQAILLVSPLKLARHQLHWRAYPRYRHYLLFTPSRHSYRVTDNGTFWLCANHPVKIKWAMFVSQSGRIRIAYPDDSGQIIASNHQPLLC